MCKCKLSFPLIVIKKKNNIKTVMKIAILMKKMDTEGISPSGYTYSVLGDLLAAVSSFQSCEVLLLLFHK